MFSPHRMKYALCLIALCMMTSSNKKISTLMALCEGNPPVTGGFPLQRSVTRSFDVFIEFPMNKRLNKQWRRWGFEMPSRSLWRHCNVFTLYIPSALGDSLDLHDDVIKWKHFHAQRPVTRSFDVFFDLRLNKWLSKQSWGWWLDMLLCPLWRHCNGSPIILHCWFTGAGAILRLL